MHRLVAVLAVLVVMTAGELFAWDVSIPSTYTQGDFRTLSKELGSAIAYRRLAPADSLGVTGFDVSAQASFINIDKGNSAWQKATGGNAPGYLVYPAARVRKGLPWDIDAGISYAYVSEPSIRIYGAELSKALIPGNLAMPAIGLRGTYTRLDGIRDLSLQTAGIDAAVSKGILFLTPYAGGGMTWIDSRYKGSSVNLTKEQLWQPRVFAGLKFSPLPLIGITAEAEYAVRPIYSLKLGASF